MLTTSVRPDETGFEQQQQQHTRSKKMGSWVSQGNEETSEDDERVGRGDVVQLPGKVVRKKKKIEKKSRKKCRCR